MLFGMFPYFYLILIFKKYRGQPPSSSGYPAGNRVYRVCYIGCIIDRQ
jgi:hypothetical protein